MYMRALKGRMPLASRREHGTQRTIPFNSTTEKRRCQTVRHLCTATNHKTSPTAVTVAAVCVPSYLTPFIHSDTTDTNCPPRPFYTNLLAPDYHTNHLHNQRTVRSLLQMLFLIIMCVSACVRVRVYMRACMNLNVPRYTHIHYTNNTSSFHCLEFSSGVAEEGAAENVWRRCAAATCAAALQQSAAVPPPDFPHRD